MSYRQKAKKLAKKIGAQIDINAEGHDLDFDISAPRGYHWLCDVPCDGEHAGLHGIIGSRWSDDESVDDIWKDAYERMKMGIGKCPPNCQVWS